MTKIAGSVSGSSSQKHGSEDPDPPQNAMDLEHWYRYVQIFFLKRRGLKMVANGKKPSFVNFIAVGSGPGLKTGSALKSGS
jgi:hypothetical protein